MKKSEKMLLERIADALEKIARILDRR